MKTKKEQARLQLEKFPFDGTYWFRIRWIMRGIETGDIWKREDVNKFVSESETGWTDFIIDTALQRLIDAEYLKVVRDCYKISDEWLAYEKMLPEWG